MAAIAAGIAAAPESAWTRVAARDAAARALAAPGPNPRERAGLAPDAGARRR